MVDVEEDYYTEINRGRRVRHDRRERGTITFRPSYEFYVETEDFGPRGDRIRNENAPIREHVRTRIPPRNSNAFRRHLFY